jgi:hypothetical protein
MLDFTLVTKTIRKLEVMLDSDLAELLTTRNCRTV